MNVGLLYTPVSIYQMTRGKWNIHLCPSLRFCLHATHVRFDTHICINYRLTTNPAGALVLFVGGMSVIFLKRKLYLYQWVSLFIVMGGICLVGLSGSMIKDAVKESQPVLGYLETIQDPQPQVTKVLLGIFFILFAQVL